MKYASAAILFHSKVEAIVRFVSKNMQRTIFNIQIELAIARKENLKEKGLRAHQNIQRCFYAATQNCEKQHLAVLT